MIKSKHSINKYSKTDIASLLEAIEKGEDYQEIYICDRKFTRSKKQRGYFFGYLVLSISNFTGYTPFEVNELLKLHYNPKEIVGFDGVTRIIGGSIDAESTSKCEEIFEAIRRDFNGMGLELLEPKKLTNEHYVLIDRNK